MKRLGTLILAFALLTVLALPAAAAGYTDVPSGSALADEVQKAADDKLMQGYSSTRFGYSDSMTRAQFVTVVCRMMGWNTGTVGTHVTAAMKVSASSVSAEYWKAINLAVVHDAVDTTVAFRPGAAITRAEMAEILVRALGLKGAAARAANDALPFKDVTAKKGYVAVAYTIGMTKGTTSTTFSPNRTATRAQAAAMLVRIYEKYTHSTDWVHGFYAISSYSQLSLTKSMNAVSAGWSRMTWDGTTAALSTTSANSNEYSIPSGYDSVTSYLEGNGTALNLSVFMDASGNLPGLLSSASGRSQAVSTIVNELTVSYKAIGKNPYSGVTIDFEGLRSNAKANYNAFLTELSAQVHALGKTLYVCVSPVLTTGSYYDGYDYRTIGNLADKVILMAYDYDASNLSSYVGTTYYKTAATAPIDQIYESLRAVTNASTGVKDLSKIALGFSCKNVAWKISSNGGLLSGAPSYPSNDTVLKRLSQSTTVKGWSSTYQMPYAIYQTENGEKWFLWYENDSSIKAKMELAKLFGVDDFSLWRLGIIPSVDTWNWNSVL